MIHSLLAQASDSGYGSFILMGLMLLVLYMFIIRPQQRRQRQQKQFIQAIKEGDGVVTLGGLHGKVVSLGTDTMDIEIAKGTRVTVERNAVSYDASRRKTTENKST